MGVPNDLLNDELRLMEQLIYKKLFLKRTEVMELIPNSHIGVDRQFYPRLLFISHLLSGHEITQRIIGIASSLQLLYLASEIHKYEGKKPQYPVLIGDYLYSESFGCLCKYEMLDWLIPISKTISNMQLGSIEKLKAGKSSIARIDAIAKESASLGKLTCSIGGRLAEIPQKTLEPFVELGNILGLVYGLVQDKKLLPLFVFDYLESAKEQLIRLAAVCDNKDGIYVLNQVIKDLNKSFLNVQSKVG